jgi:hypothetical protein
MVNALFERLSIGRNAFSTAGSLRSDVTSKFSELRLVCCTSFVVLLCLALFVQHIFAISITFLLEFHIGFTIVDSLTPEMSNCNNASHSKFSNTTCHTS